MPEQSQKSLILQQFIPYRMVNTAKRISDNLSKIYSSEEFDVTIPEWRILAHLAERERLNARDIGRIALMDKSKVSRGVKLLDDKGLLIKEKDEADNRVTYLSLSEAGRRLYHQLAPHALEWESALIGALDTSEYRDLMRILEKLDKQLDQLQSY